MPALTFPSAFGRQATAVVLVISLAACRDGDGRVIVSGDVDGLDTLALRGDSLFAEADRLPRQIDSLRAVIEGRLPPSAPLPPTDSLVASLAGTLSAAPAPTEGAELTRKAQERGDSMARAAAARFAESANANSRARADTARGMVRLVGTAPAQQPVLQPSDGLGHVTLSGMVTSGMQRLEGLDVVVRGVRVSPRDIVVADYIVRGADGIPAYDGTLVASDDGYSLVLTDGSGRKRLSNVPTSLRDVAGARVWVSIPDGSSTPRRYGIIPRR